jgi:hypothetical protein
MATVSVEEFQKAIHHLYGTHYFKKRKDDILSGVMVSFEENTVLLAAGDSIDNLQIRIKSWESLDQEYHPILIPYQSLVPLQKNLLGRFLKITSEELNSLKLECGEMCEILKGRSLDLSSIDRFDDKSPRGEVTINRAEFIECVSICEKYAQKDLCGDFLAQTLMTGIHIAVTQNTARAEATDSHFLMRVAFPVTSQYNFKFTIPSDLPRRWLAQEWDKITIKVWGDRITAINDIGRIEFQGMAIPEGMYSYPSHILDVTIGKTLASTVMSPKVVPQGLMRFFGKIGLYKAVTLVCEAAKLHIHELEVQSDLALCFERPIDGESLAWATVSKEKLAVMCAAILPAVKEAIFHLSTNATDRSAVVIAYEHRHCSFTAAIMQLPINEGSLRHQLEKDLVDSYFKKFLPSESIDIVSTGVHDEKIDVDPTEIFGDVIEDDDDEN